MYGTATRPVRTDDAIFAAPLAFCDYGIPRGVAHRLRPFMAAMRAEGADVVRRVQATPPLLHENFARKNGAGRDAALCKIITRMARQPVAREGRVAVWRYTVAMASPLPDYARDVVEVRSLCVGRLRDTLCMHESAWCLGATDHALARIMERGTDDPRTALLDAHDALCGLTDIDLAALFDMEAVLLRAGSGAFLGSFHVTLEPPPNESEAAVYFLAETWLSFDQLRADQERQVAAFRTCTPRYLTGPLCPLPLRAAFTMQQIEGDKTHG